jgi:hypothetical protein
MAELLVMSVADAQVRDGAGATWLAFALSCTAQNSADAPGQDTKQDQNRAPSKPTALPIPVIVGPLQAVPPINFEAGPIGKLSLNGVASGFGLFQGNEISGNEAAEGAVSNAQLWLQKTTGWFQFYVQAGAYDILSLGTPFISTEKSISDLWGPVPIGYMKLVPAKNTSIEIGALPTLLGAEYTFDFQDLNVERGLLWNQTNAITHGIQINQTLGKFSASFSWNDSYYSSRYTALSGSLAYTSGPHIVAFIGGGNLGQANWQSLVTPIQNNGQLYDLIYSYTKGKWMLEPSVQYNSVPALPALGIVRGASAWGGAIAGSRMLAHGFSLAGRWEYISSSGSVEKQSANLIFGPGSAAWSVTATPTYQYRRFFARGEFSLVKAIGYAPGNAFGSNGNHSRQPRGIIEVGVLL